MVEINAKSKEIYLESRYGIKNRHIIVNDKFSRIWIPKSVALFCDLKKGEYIHFLNEGTEWRFYSNDDSDGFPILSIGKLNRLFLSSLPLARLILKTTGFHKEKSFYVEKTRMEKDKCEVFYLNPNN